LANEEGSGHDFPVSVTIGVLYWVYHDPNRRAQMVEALRNAEYRWVLMAMLAYLVVEAAAAFRWHVLLKVQNIHLSVPRLTGLFFIGLFYNQFLPEAPAATSSRVITC
jgi:Predicted integral membrane protein